VVNKYEITINGKMYTVEVQDITASSAQVVVNGERKAVAFREIAGAAVAPAVVSVPQPAAPAVAQPAPAEAPAPKPEPAPAPAAAPMAPVSGQGKVVGAPMPGKVLSKVKAGDKVASGDIVCTLEAMKMEMPISSTDDGTVLGIHVQVGDTVPFDAPLLTIG
jgi:biotin carboxyl carrier protein